MAYMKIPFITSANMKAHVVSGLLGYLIEK